MSTPLENKGNVVVNYVSFWSHLTRKIIKKNERTHETENEKERKKKSY